ncbi:hypothetical protein HQQ94_06555 [Shewanella sp. VB17]|uniref:hypothetical protein n=1 Tax=Shewanella sp. VB17 TaxID=2739432 RepID=UPI0015654951|nr:hypothetical protein [Shewanella sp. VB17]NRD72904.1 hypothetical protein [Shewanella sp. VB17]
MKIKLILISVLSLSLLPTVVLANDDLAVNDDTNIEINGESNIETNDETNIAMDDTSNKISLVIEKGSSVESILTDFVTQFDYQIKWDTEDFISGYRVSYVATDPMDVLKQFINDVRENGKLIKATIYKNNILVVENESK